MNPGLEEITIGEFCAPTRPIMRWTKAKAPTVTQLPSALLWPVFCNGLLLCLETGRSLGPISNVIIEACDWIPEFLFNGCFLRPLLGKKKIVFFPSGRKNPIRREMTYSKRLKIYICVCNIYIKLNKGAVDRGEGRLRKQRTAMQAGSSNNWKPSATLTWKG